MKKVALIGLGKWGTNILRELVSLGNNVVVLLHNKDETKEEWIIRNYPDVSFTYQISDLKDDESIEVVFVATPMSTHYEVCTDFLVSNKRIYVEKPITNSLDTAQKLLESMKILDFMVGLIFLYHECFKHLLNIAKNEKVVEVIATKTLRTTSDPTSSKDLFLDTFIHEMSILIKLFGEPIQAIYNKDTKKLEVDFKDTKASVVLLEQNQQEKIRKFEFVAHDGKYLWNNDELFDKNGDLMCKPEVSTLKSELSIFLNEYSVNKDYIDSNNKIAVTCVGVLEEIYNRF